MKNSTTNKIFAAKWGFTQIFLFFTIGCMIGVFYEELLTYFTRGYWESRRGLIYGPFNPVYGLGFAAFVFFLGKNNSKREWYLTLLYSAILGGFVEYFLSLLSEIIFNSKSWDYNGYFLNIGGRTTVPFMIFWGFGGLVFMKYIYPFVVRAMNRIPYGFSKIAFPTLVVLLSINIFISYTALIRWSNRIQGNPPMSPLGELYDKIYPDDFLRQIYPNIWFVTPDTQ